MTGSNRKSVSVAVLSVSGVLALAGSALAQCDVYRLHQPDFDQRRILLLGNGSMYCVPTSVLNCMAYAANYGMPGLGGMLQGPQNWESQSLYPTVSLMDLEMGFAMGTDPNDGTNGSGAHNGAQSWINAYAPGSLVVSSLSASGGYAPTPFDLAIYMSIGHLVCPVFGRYVVFPGAGYNRVGGHMTTLASVRDGCSFLPTLGLRDPAADENPNDILMQSPFATSPMGMFAVTGDFRYIGQNGHDHRTQWRNIAQDSETYLDGVMLLSPTFALTDHQQFGVPQVDVPISFTPDPEPEPAHIVLPGDLVPHGSALHADPSKVVVAGKSPSSTSGNGKVFIVDRLWGNATPICDTASTQVRLTTGRHLDVYVADGSHIKRIDPGRPEARTMGETLSPITPDALAYDDANDRLVVLSTAEGHLALFDMDLSRSTDARLPADVTLAGRGSVAVNPADRSIWVTSERSAAIWQIVPDTAAPGGLRVGEQILLPAVRTLRSLCFDDRGHAMFIGDGVVMDLFKDANEGGRWVPAAESLFAGLTVGEVFEVARSRTNHDPVMDASEVNIEDPEPLPSIPDCDADFNQDGVANADDLGDFITAFFAPVTDIRLRDRRVDVNGDGQVNADDLGDFVTAYFNGC